MVCDEVDERCFPGLSLSNGRRGDCLLDDLPPFVERGEVPARDHLVELRLADLAVAVCIAHADHLVHLLVRCVFSNIIENVL